MKINDQISATIATLAMPNAKNMLTDIGDGIINYYKQKDETEKNQILMDAARMEANDSKTLADFMQTGGSLSDFNATGGKFKTPEAAAKANNFWQNNQNYDFAYKDSMRNENDVPLLIKFYDPNTTLEEKAKIQFESPKTYQMLQTEDQKKQKLGLDALETQYKGIKIKHDIKKDNFDILDKEQDNIRADKQLGLQGVSVQNNLNKTQLDQEKFNYQRKKDATTKPLTPSEIKAKAKLDQLARDDIENTYKTKAGDTWADHWDGLSEEEKSYAIDYYKKYKGMPKTEQSFSIFGGRRLHIIPYEKTKQALENK